MPLLLLRGRARSLVMMMPLLTGGGRTSLVPALTSFATVRRLQSTVKDPELRPAISVRSAKDPENLSDCLKYRILMILPMLYRTWAAIRLQHLDSWKAEWHCEESFAGSGNAGAEDAAWLAALQFELAGLKGENITGGTGHLQVLRSGLETSPGEAARARGHACGGGGCIHAIHGQTAS